MTVAPASRARTFAATIDLLGELSSSDRDLTVQLEAVETLGEIRDDRSVSRLRALATTHARPEVRREAIETLVEHAAPADAIAFLRQVIDKDGDEGVRTDAVESLAEVNDPAARVALDEIARSQKDEHLRAEAVESLGALEPAAAAVDVLKGIALRDASAHVRDEALETLAGLADGAGISALVEIARSHPDAEMRKHALEQLLDSDHPRAREVFERALKAPDR